MFQIIEKIYLLITIEKGKDFPLSKNRDFAINGKILIMNFHIMEHLCKCRIIVIDNFTVT